MRWEAGHSHNGEERKCNCIILNLVNRLSGFDSPLPHKKLEKVVMFIVIYVG